MTSEEAIEILEELWRYEHAEKYSDKEIRMALGFAIEAIKAKIDDTPYL